MLLPELIEQVYSDYEQIIIELSDLKRGIEAEKQTLQLVASEGLLSRYEVELSQKSIEQAIRAVTHLQDKAVN